MFICFINNNVLWRLSVNIKVYSDFQNIRKKGNFSLASPCIFFPHCSLFKIFYLFSDRFYLFLHCGKLFALRSKIRAGRNTAHEPKTIRNPRRSRGHRRCAPARRPSFRVSSRRQRDLSGCLYPHPLRHGLRCAPGL